MFGNIIAGIIVTLLISFAVYSVYKNRKQGKCCGCSSDCPSHSRCGKS